MLPHLYKREASQILASNARQLCTPPLLAARAFMTIKVRSSSLCSREHRAVARTALMPGRFSLAQSLLIGSSASMHTAVKRPLASQAVELLSKQGSWMAGRRASLCNKPSVPVGGSPPGRWTPRWIYENAKEMALHYYHGTKLLIADTKVASRLLSKLVAGRNLTRREHKLLVRVLADLSRVIPLAFFVLVRCPAASTPFHGSVALVCQASAMVQYDSST